ncbi:MAG: terpene cyclase/mutase family protein [Chloroflexi bacterium]|nr:terpene cyclase/mutase family protein [Chloroflexota bacterium]
MLDLERAYTFVREGGTDIERARLDYLLTGGRPPETIVVALFASQRGDGSWAPFWATDYSSLDATCYRLAQAEQLGLADAEPARRGLRFLAARQGSDVSWEEARSVRNVAPPWARPGDVAAQIYLTANCGYSLALGGRFSEAVGPAARFLADHLRNDGALPTFPHAHWLAAGLWYRVGGREAARCVMTHLAALLPGLPPSNLGWLVSALHRAGVPMDDRLLTRAAERLVQEQQPDGRWVSEDGPGRDVHATLEALRALRLLNR